MLDRPTATPGAPTLDEHALARPSPASTSSAAASCRARSGKTFAVVNPATGEEVGQAAEGDAADVDAAVADADRGAEGMGEDAGPQARRAGRAMRRAADASMSRSSPG